MSRKYLAYSSNIAPTKMMELCPSARFIGHTDIEEYRLVFAGGTEDAVATIEPAPGYSVPALAWKIHAEDEAILDNYIEFERHFLKKEFEVWLRDIITACPMKSTSLRYETPARYRTK